MFDKPSKDFIDSIVTQCIANFTQEDIALIKKHPQDSLDHFGYGLYIRNHYLYNNPYIVEHGFYNIDGISSIIIEEIKFRIVPGYEKEY